MKLLLLDTSYGLHYRTSVNSIKTLIKFANVNTTHITKGIILLHSDSLKEIQKLPYDIDI